MFVSDVDGTLTSGHMVFDENGGVSKGYHTRDVTALWLLQRAGIRVLVLTGSNHDCDRHRFKFLADSAGVIDGGNAMPLSEVLVQGMHDKATFLDGFLKSRGIKWDEVAYIGDAENDLEAMRRAGWSACPKDAEESIRSVSTHVMHKNGGECAVREFADLVMSTMERIHARSK